MRSVKDKARRETWIVPAAVGGVVFAGLCFPLAVAITNGLQLAGATEESTGYRYFYTLRMMYGINERPWLPQGQAVGVVHMGIQLLLTFVGLPPTQLMPRIEYFLYLATTLSHLITTVTFAWAVKPLQTITGKLMAALIFVGIFYERRLVDFFKGYLISPDYLTWTGAIAMVTAAWAIRIVRNGVQLNARQIVLLGLFAGVCLAVKVTLFIFPMTVGLILLGQNGYSRRAFAAVGLSGLLSCIVFVGVLYAYYLGNWEALATHFSHLRYFIATNTNRPGPFVMWWFKALFTSYPVQPIRVSVDTTSAALVTPLLLLVAMWRMRRRHVVAALLFGSLASVGVSYSRFYPVTIIELDCYWMSAALIFAALIYQPWIEMQRRNRMSLMSRPSLRVAAKLCFFGVLCASQIMLVIAFHRPYIQWVSAVSDVTAALRTFNQQHPGRTLFLVPDNEFRIPTVDSAIAKGGTDVFSNRWGHDSTLMPSMFPDRWYLLYFTTFGLPSELDGFEKIVLVAKPGRLHDKIAFDEMRFRVTLEEFDHVLTIDRSTELNGVVHGFVRRRQTAKPVDAREQV